MRRTARRISPCHVRAGCRSRIQTRRPTASISTWLANDDAVDAHTMPMPASTRAHRRRPSANASQTPATTGRSSAFFIETVRAVRARGGRK